MIPTLDPIYVHELKIRRINAPKIKVGDKEYCQFAVYAITDEPKGGAEDPFVKIDETDLIRVSTDVRIDMVDDGVTRIYPPLAKSGFVYDAGYHRIVNEETFTPMEMEE